VGLLMMLVGFAWLLKGLKASAPPAAQRFWVVSAHGSGTQTVAWDLEDGDWSVVVMNEDASRGVHARISAGVKATFLGTEGWVSTGAGLLLLIGAGAVLVRTRRRTRGRAAVVA
jgi:hypothetical protein